jgi:hypothetical protein
VETHCANNFRSYLERTILQVSVTGRDNSTAVHMLSKFKFFVEGYCEKLEGKLDKDREGLHFFLILFCSMKSSRSLDPIAAIHARRRRTLPVNLAGLRMPRFP